MIDTNNAYTAATEVAGPGAVLSVGKGVEAHYSTVRQALEVNSHGRGTHSLLNIPVGLASGEGRAASEGLGGGDDLRAVNHRIRVVAELSEGGEDELEVGLELVLVVCRCSEYLQVSKKVDESVPTKDCHSQAVRLSRAMVWSDRRRISPGRGDSTSPWFPPVL